MPGLERGWALLADGAWPEARAAFREAGETAEALEGLSWAAWWLDDADAVFAARERAHRLYRRRGDAAGAARMATWLACDELDFRGADAVAGGWLARARRLLEGVEPCAEHGWLAFFDGYLAGDPATALRRGAEAAALGRRLGVVDVELLGLALEGATLVAGGDVGAGLRRLDEATAAALDGGVQVPIAGAWACCFLVTACLTVRDYPRAAAWCDRIEEFARRYGSRYMLAFCRAEYAAVEVWRGRWREAEALLVAAIDDYRSSRPALLDGPLAGLAELRRRQGRAEEAARLLAQARPMLAAQLCHARLAHDRGDTLGAAERVERLLRQVPSGPGRAAALELLVAVRGARGELERARRASDDLRTLAATAPLRAAADLAEGRCAAAAGDHERARERFEDAIDGFERSGGRYDAADARLALAASLSVLGRDDAARREAATALDVFAALGAPLDAERARGLLAPEARAPVTPREREVLALLADGLTNRQIADRLVLSEHTVHRHVTNILHKLGLPSRAAAAAYAVRRSLVDR